MVKAGWARAWEGRGDERQRGVGDKRQGRRWRLEQMGVLSEFRRLEPCGESLSALAVVT